MAEIVRLAGFIPQDFIDPSLSKYKQLILDFSYFTRAAHYEKMVEEYEVLFIFRDLIFTCHFLLLLVNVYVP